MPLRPTLTGDGAPPPWRVLEARPVFSAEPYVQVWRQTVALPDGRIVDDYFRVHLGDYACVYPVTADGRVVLLRQYSHGLGRTTLGFPGGHCRPSEDPADGVRRELLEETGYAAARIRPLARTVVDGNKHCGQAHLFAASGCRRVAEPDGRDLEATDIVLLRPADLLAAARQGEIGVLAHLALLGLATHPQLGVRHTTPRRSRSISE